MSRQDTIDAILSGLDAVEGLQGIPINPGWTGPDAREFIAVAPEIEGNRSVPAMQAGRVQFDDKWVLPIWIGVSSESADALRKVTSRYHEIEGHVVTWLRDNVGSLPVDENLSVAGDDGPFADSMAAGVTEDGASAVGHIDIPIHNRLND